MAPNGPLICKGDRRDRGRAALWRCGGSENKPLCDGSHNRIGFDG